MTKKEKLLNDPFFLTVIGNRALRLYKDPVDDELGIPGLHSLIIEKTGQEAKLDEAYVFIIKDNNAAKIITRDCYGLELLEFHEGHGDTLKELILEL